MRFSLGCLFLSLALAVTLTPADSSAAPLGYKLANSTYMVKTRSKFGAGKTVYCAFKGNQRRGTPALIRTIKSNHYATFLTSTSLPRLPRSLKNICQTVERPCKPNFSGASPAVAQAGSVHQLSLSASMPKGCGNSITFSVASTTAGSRVVINHGALLYFPSLAFSGVEIVTVKATNILGQTAQQVFSFDVQGNTPTPATTISATPTLVSTPLRTPTPTPTATATSTPPTVVTTIPTRTFTATATSTSTAIITSTPTRTATSTATRTATVIPTTISTPTRTSTPTSTPTVVGINCTPVPGYSSTTISVSENTPVTVTVPVTVDSRCSTSGNLVESTSATHGTISIQGRSLTYTPFLHFTGSDSVVLRLTTPTGSVPGPTINFNVVAQVAEFAGIETELGNYRDTLTPNEVRHLLCKYALCGSPELYQIGIQYGRQRLIQALINYDTDPLTSTMRTRIQSTLGTTPDAFAMSKAESVARTTGCSSNGLLWTPESAEVYWMSQLRWNSPLREHIALHLHQHIPVNANVNLNGGIGGGCSSQGSYKAYVDLMRMHALGRPAQGPSELPITGDFRAFLEDLLTDYQMGLYLDHIQPWQVPGPYGYNDWVHGNASNNFARELLQVFTLGQYNVYSGALNYTENDVNEVSRSLAGNINEFSGDLRQVPQIAQRPWKLGGNVAGRSLLWNTDYRDVGTKTIFENASAPVRKVGDLTPPNVLDSIVKHDGFAYVPRTFFQRSVYPGPDVSVVQQLDTYFRSNSFNVPQLYNLMMNSSATFSPRARYGCIANGPIHLFRLLNTLGLKVSSIAGNPLNASDGHATFTVLAERMQNLGNMVYETPSIFGFGECGDDDGLPGSMNYGEGELTTQRLLGHYNLPFWLMKYYLEGNYPWAFPQVQENFDYRSLLPSGISNPTAAQVVAHFENLFGVTLTSAERTIVMQQMDPSTGARPAWNPANARLVQFRVANLVSIFANLPEVNIR